MPAASSPRGSDRIALVQWVSRHNPKDKAALCLATAKLAFHTYLLWDWGRDVDHHSRQNTTVILHVIMTSIAQQLDGLNMSQYLDDFCKNGFASWDDVLDITKTELYVGQPVLLKQLLAFPPRAAKDIKLGHRRVKSANLIVVE